MNLAAIPAELRAEPRWILWRLEERDGKPTKVPYRAGGEGKASSTNSATWTTFEEAVAASGTADGIGFVLGDGWVGVDLDNVLGEDGWFLPEFPLDEVGTWLAALNSYTERSPSRTGLHVIGCGELPSWARNRRGPVEVYGAGRFFTVTGDVFEGLRLVREIGDVLEAFLDAAGLRRPGPTSNGGRPSVPLDLDDRELIELAMRAKNGATFARLWSGDWSGYASQSEADLALCNYLAFWWRRDPVAIDRLFRRSGLYREKWERDNYRGLTIEAAIASTTDVYEPSPAKPVHRAEPVSEPVVETGSRPPRRDAAGEPVHPFTCIGERVSEPARSAAPSADSVGLVFQSAAAFAAVDEPSAELVLGLTGDDAAFVAGGTVILFGKGGAGKTTLSLDLACHLATGTDWQTLRVPRPRAVAVIEQDGPRGRFRRKVRAKLAAWEGDEVGTNLQFLAEPWAELRLSVESHRAALAEWLNEHKVDVLIAGPIVSLGMIGGGTPDEVSAFEAHLKALRDLLERPLLLILLHHTNQRGQISGAWDRVPDTLMFVVNTGRGTRLKWEKARDGDSLHATTWKLRWKDGMTYELDETPEVTEEDVEEAILAVVRENPGTTWTRVRRAVTGGAEKVKEVRDRMIAEGLLVNRGKGQAFALWHPDDVEDADDEQSTLLEDGA